MLFNTLLIPVDFTSNTDIAISKAIELIDSENAVIHLLHVTSPLSARSIFSIYPFQSFTKIETGEYETEKLKLLKLKMKIAKKLPGVIVQTQFVEGRIEDSIIKAARTLNPELIIIGKHKRQRLLPFLRSVSPERISTSTNCPVLTVKPGSIDQKIRSIVVPINKFVPTRKIELLSILSKRFHVKIHLVTLLKDNAVTAIDTSNELLQTYRILKERSLHSQLEFKALKGKNLAKESLKYAESIMADLLLVNPDTETKVSFITGQQVTDKLLKNSRLQVLEVKPYPFLS